MKTRRMMMAIALLMTCVLLFGTCCSALAEQGEEITLTVWCWDEYYNVPIMEKAAEIYNRTHPEVKIVVENVITDDIYTRIYANISAGTVENLPDIALICDYDYMKFIEMYRDDILDTTELFPFDQFSEGKVSNFSYEGRQYGVPLDCGIGGLFYRADLFEQAGITDDQLQDLTWNEYIALGEQVKEKTGVALTYLDAEGYAGVIVQQFFQSAGAGVYDEEGNLHIRDNEVLRVSLETLKELYECDAVIQTNGWDDYVGKVNNGEVASVVNGAWFIGSIKAAEDQSGKWKVAPAPRLDYEGSTHAMDTTGCSWMLFNGKTQNDAAMAFLNEIYAGNEEFYSSILSAQGAICSWLPSLELPAYDEPDEFFSGQAVYRTFADMLPDCKYLDLHGYCAEFDNALYQAATAYLNGEVDVDGAMAMTEDLYLTIVG